LGCLEGTGLKAGIRRGMSCGLAPNFLSGILLKPVLGAKPGSVITRESAVIIWCEGTLGAQEYHLYEEGSTASWDRQKPLHPRNKVKFPIPSMSENYAG
jgi:leukocyte immunoglobulin-like receptor